MPKELPYFQFESSQWRSGSIQLCSLPAKGLFIEICALYWDRDCNLNRKHIERMFNAPDELSELEEEGMVKFDENGGAIIGFLNKQKEEIERNRKKASELGKKGAKKRWGNSGDSGDDGKPPHSPPMPTPKPPHSGPTAPPIAYKRREEEIRGEKRKEDIPPKPPKGGGESSWETFCKIYPLKADYYAAQVAWCKINPDLWPKILEDVPKRFKNTDRQFVPDAHKYLKGNMWEMEIRKTGNGNSPPKSIPPPRKPPIDL